MADKKSFALRIDEEMISHNPKQRKRDITDKK
jgi:hypothetical protein